MSGKLQRLIAHYEEERDNLEDAIAECLAEHEYKLAHRYEKGRRLINRKLQNLYNLADPLHNEKESRLQFIEFYQRKKAEKDELPSDYYEVQIQREQAKLEQLNQASQAAPVSPKQSVLSEALNKLGDREIDQFTLLLDEAKKLRFTVRLVRQTLFVTLPEVRRRRKNYVLNKPRMRYLHALGFRLYDHDDKLIRWLHYDGEPAKNQVRTLLARIVFEGFYFKEFAGQASIRYWEKPAA